MVREMEQDEENYRSKLFHFKAMQENNNATKHSKSLSMESASVLFSSDNNDLFSNRSQGSTPLNDTVSDKPPTNRQDKGPTKAKPSRDDAAIKQPKDQPPTGLNIFLSVLFSVF